MITNLWITIKFEFLYLVRNKQFVFSLLLFISLSLYSIYYGSSKIQQQNHTIAEITDNYVKQIHGYIERLQRDTSTLEGKYAYEEVALPAFASWRQAHPVYSTPHPLAALSIGQRDLQPYYNFITARSVYDQLFSSDIANPQKLLAGNLDFAFVLIFLLPLLIITLTYNLVSVEKERGRLPLLKTYTKSIRSIFVSKLSFYFFFISVLILILTTAGIMVAQINIIEHYGLLLVWVLASILYTGFWFSICFLVVSFNKNSAFNAITLLGIWIAFLILIPSGINILSNTLYPSKNSELTDLIRRTGIEETELEMKKMVVKFFEKHREYKQDISDIKYLMPKAYSASVEFLDEEGRQVVAAYEARIGERSDFVHSLSVINPASVIQKTFNSLSNSDYSSYKHFLNSVESYHKKILGFYQTKLFSDDTFTRADYLNLPKFEMEEEYHDSLISRNLSMLGGIAVIISIIALWRFKVEFK